MRSGLPSSYRVVGVVTWYNLSKGYGEVVSLKGEYFFISSDSISPKHSKRRPKRGTVVNFYRSDDSVFGLRVAEDIVFVSELTIDEVQKIKEEHGIEVTN